MTSNSEPLDAALPDAPTPAVGGALSARDRGWAAQSRERLKLALSAAKGRGQDALRLALIGGGGGEFVALDMPRAALSALEQVLALMSAGQAVTVNAATPAVARAPNRLSTQQVALVLGVSRPFVVSEILAGRMACVKVGRHRRLAPSEVDRYRRIYMAPAGVAAKF